MTDEGFNALLASLGQKQRRDTVRLLLAGNDTQCFTSRQYAEMYHRVAHRDDPVHRDAWIEWLIELAPKHMESVGMVEVAPGTGIWKEYLFDQEGDIG